MIAKLIAKFLQKVCLHKYADDFSVLLEAEKIIIHMDYIESLVELQKPVSNYTDLGLTNQTIKKVSWSS